jgi:hypothetical protein
MVGRWRALKHRCTASCPSGPSPASCHLHFATLFFLGDASPFCCSFHSFRPIPTVLFAERSGILEFSHRIERKLMQGMLCCAVSTHANWLVCTCSFKDLSFPRTYNPYLSSCLHRTGFGAKYASEKRIAFSNEPPNRVGSGDTKLAPIYMQMAMLSTAEWVCGRPTSFPCNTGHALASKPPAV